MARYATAKKCAMMTADELDRRLRAANKPITVNSWSPGVVPTTQAGRGVNPIMKRIITTRWFVNFMGSHVPTEEEAAQALGDLLVSAKYSGASGKYFDGFKEIPSSVESRDERKARAGWEQSAKLAGLSLDGAENLRVLGPSAAALYLEGILVHLQSSGLTSCQLRVANGFSINDMRKECSAPSAEP